MTHFLKTASLFVSISAFGANTPPVTCEAKISALGKPKIFFAGFRPRDFSDEPKPDRPNYGTVDWHYFRDFKLRDWEFQIVESEEEVLSLLHDPNWHADAICFEPMDLRGFYPFDADLTKRWKAGIEKHPSLKVIALTLLGEIETAVVTRTLGAAVPVRRLWRLDFCPADAAEAIDVYLRTGPVH